LQNVHKYVTGIRSSNKGFWWFKSYGNIPGDLNHISISIRTSNLSHKMLRYTVHRTKSHIVLLKFHPHIVKWGVLF